MVQYQRMLIVGSFILGCLSIQVRGSLEVLNLCKASSKGNTELVGQLLRKGIDPNLADEHGDTALMRAAFHGKRGVAVLLMKHGADPNAVCGFKRTPLIWAFRCNNQDLANRMADELVDRGAVEPVGQEINRQTSDKLKKAGERLQKRRHARYEEISMLLEKRGGMPKDLGAVVVNLLWKKPIAGKYHTWRKNKRFSK